jgi:hypothetical protein
VGEDIGDSIESYDPISKCWQTVDKLPEARFSMGVVCLSLFIPRDLIKMTLHYLSLFLCATLLYLGLI